MNLRLVLNIILIFLISNFSSCEKSEKKFDSVVYGHAGTGDSEERWIYPPNTEKAILYAINILDSDGVEVDVRFSSDSVAMVFHDSELSDKTNGSGCIEEWKSDDLIELEFYVKHKITKLKKVVNHCVIRKKFLFIDIKPANFCSGGNVDSTLLNKALNDAFEGLTHEEKQRITVSSIIYNSITAIEDTSIIKAFESESYDKSYEFFQLGLLDKLVFRYQIIGQSESNQMRDEQIPFCLFAMKTQQDIKKGYALIPDEMIVDNIAYAQKIMN